MPPYIKIIVLAQAATILSLAVVMYQVFLNDAYFQQYVIGLFQSNVIADATLSMVTASVFAIGTFTILGSMSTRREAKQWRLLSDEAKAPPMPTLPVLETVERPSKPRSRTRRPRTRKRRADVDKLYDSIRFFADDRGQE